MAESFQGFLQDGGQDPSGQANACVLYLVMVDGPVWVAGVAGVVVAVFTIVGALLRERVRRNSPKAVLQREVDKALRKGCVPPGSVHPGLQANLEKRLRSDRAMAWIGPIMFGGFSCMSAVLLVFPDDVDQPAWRLWIISLTLLAAGIWMVFFVRREIRTIEALLRDIDGGPGGGAA